MNEFVVYHNPDSMGYTGKDVEDLGIYTSKTCKDVLGANIWIIAGEGRPRRYYLRAMFVASEIAASDNPNFKHVVRGKAGHFLYPMPRIDEQPWFPSFRKSQGNFAFGFSPTKVSVSIAGLRAVLKSASV
jgi:hypothetical protein